MLPPLRIVPDPHERVWGGRRLGAPGRLPIGELWVVGGANPVAGGPFAGRTLDKLAAELGAELVGTRAIAIRGPRFPFLVKLLDPQAWLSVQVHPDDALARRLAGPDAVGKTEAWYVLDAAPGATLLVGVREGVDAAAVRTAITSPDGPGSLLARYAVEPGDALLIPAGTLHAVGPGVFLYELQQPSDITYRCYDWGRPAGPERPLHIAESLASVRPASRPEPVHPVAAPGERALLAACEHFVLELLCAGEGAPELAADGTSVHVLTAVEGGVEVAGGPAGSPWSIGLGALESAVVPATAGAYRLRSAARAARVLLARVPAAGGR